MKKSIFQHSPVYELLHNFHKVPNQWAARYVLILSAIILRTAVGLGSFSGQKDPPMYGDFEAQRHWMELTIHLPISQWYFFDLPYWGLDYPPLTAYHSWLCGQIGRFINPSWFELNVSRGNEDVKVFMRVSSLVSELIFYIPSVLGLCSLLGKRAGLARMDQIIVSVVILNQAHLILIDHGHFQFNSVMMGFFVRAVSELVKDNLVSASIWFMCCVFFKQMGLYYSTFIFVYILSQLRSFSQLVVVGFTVVATSTVILFPFLLHNPKESLLQIAIRVFPFSRGLFEDKVANFWCTTNVLFKYREWLDPQQLPRLALVSTLASMAFINVVLFYKLRYKNVDHVRAMLLGFTGNAFSFYLFSYQVHEKSILLPLLPTLLLLVQDPRLITIVQWINNVGTFSMYPLLKRDGLALQYVVTNVLVNWLVGGVPRKRSWGLVIWGSYVAMGVFHVLDLLEPPKRYPDLWVLLNCGISVGCFGVFWLWVNWRVYKL